MIRVVSDLDAPALEQIHRSAFGPHGWSEKVFADQLRLPGTWGLIDACGGMGLARSVVDEAELLTLAVLPESRRLGIGGKLLALLLKEAKTRGCTAMFLEVSERNHVAQALYGAHGFTQVGKRPRYYENGVDAFIMRALLDAPSPRPAS